MPAVIQLPIGAEGDYLGIIDIWSMTATIYHDDKGEKLEVIEIPDEYKAQAEDYHVKLIDILTTFDDDLMEKVLDDEVPTTDDLHGALRRGTLGGHCVPILNGSAFKNKGVQPMLDAVVDFLPSPLDLPPTHGHQAGQGRRHRAASPTTTSPSRRWPSRS